MSFRSLILPPNRLRGLKWNRGPRHRNFCLQSEYHTSVWIDIETLSMKIVKIIKSEHQKRSRIFMSVKNFFFPVNVSSDL